jgi:hypothetical protein
MEAYAFGMELRSGVVLFYYVNYFCSNQWF